MYIFSLGYIKDKWAHAGFQRYFQNLGWMFFARIGSMAISFLATAYIARNLGPTNYGELSYAISFVSLFGFLASFGIDQILCRDLIKYPEKRNEYMGSAMMLRMVASVFAILLCILSAFIWSTNDVSIILIIIVSLSFVFSSFQLLSYEFQAEAKLKYPSILTTGVILLLNILKIGVIFYNQGVIYLALVILLEPILYAIGLIYLRTNEYGSIKNWKFNKGIMISMAKDSFPLIFASAFFSIYARIDQVMIKNMLDAESVGLYDSAVRISEIWYFIPHIIVAGLFPTIINAKKVSNQLYSKRAKKLLFIVFGVSLLTALPTAILSKYLITIIFGSSFIGALNVLQIYVWSNVGAALNTVMQQFLIAENFTKTISVAAFCGMIVNVILNIVLIPKYGMEGAAYASLVSYFVPFLSIFIIKNTRVLMLDIFK